MNKIIGGLFFACLLAGCNGSDSWDCIKSTGDIHQEEISVDFFNKLDVRHRVQLIVKQGIDKKVILETGENLRSKINFTVKDSILRIENENSCNLYRNYGETKVYVTSPDLVEIRNASGLPVLSKGILKYDRLDLISRKANIEGEIHNVGDFELNIDVNKLNVTADGNSAFFIKGQAERAFIGFYTGIPRFEGADLTMQELRIFHSSSNDIIVNPQQAIRGKLLSVGNLISLNQPPVVEVEEFWDGRLIFQD